MILLLAAIALTGELTLAAVDGELTPGLSARVEVAATDDTGHPPSGMPRLVAHGASFRLLGPVAEGVWALSLTPAVGVDEVRVDAFFDASVASARLPVRALPPSTLVVPRRVDASAGAEEVTFLVTGPHLPPPEGLAVAVGEGRVIDVTSAPDGLLVRVAPEASPYPRVVPVGVLDATRDEQPAWTSLRLRTRPRLALQTERGTRLVLTVGSRTYGPFVADEHGVVTVVVDQYPGEMSAAAVFTDDLGNETRTTLPLSSHTQPSIVALASGPVAPDGAPPRMFLHALHGDGHVWSGSRPTCRTPTAGALEPIELARGVWTVPLPDARGRRPEEIRLLCQVGVGVEVRPRVPVADGLATRLRLRVWPEELSADFPVGEVHVALEDARGEPMPVEGVSVDAELGSVTVEEEGGYALRGEYLGRAAIPTGQDVVTATYRAPPGGPDVRRVEVRHGDVPRSGEIEVAGRALDARGRPVPGVRLSLDAGGAPQSAITDATGWARATVPLPDGTHPVTVQASTGGLRARRLTLRRQPGIGGPDAPDLTARKVVSIVAGRVSEVAVRVDPPVLYTGPGAVAFVTVDVADRSGAPVTDVDVELEVSEGTISAPRRQPDGSWRAEYTPVAGERAREVTVTARAEGTSSSTRLVLEPRPLLRAPSVALGALTNFGEISSPALALDMDWRVPILGGSTVLRVGALTYTGGAEVDTGFGEKLRLRMVLVPLQVSLLARRELGGRSLWVGLGGVVSPVRTVARFGEAEPVSGVGVLPPGLALTGGIGQRFGAGEVMLELRGLALANPGGAVAFQGPVGGVGLLLGYRLIY